MAFPTNSWHIVGLFAMPCGSTIHSYLWSGSSWLQEGRVKANLGQSCTQRGIEKKQSLISMTIIGHEDGKADNKGSPLCTGPMSCIWLLIARRSCNNLHFSDFFLMTNMGVFQGETEGLRWPSDSCSWTRDFAACNFSEDRGHWGTHTGSSVFQVMGIPSSAAPRKNPDPCDHFLIQVLLGRAFPGDFFLSLPSCLTYLGAFPPPRLDPDLSPTFPNRE